MVKVRHKCDSIRFVVNMCGDLYKLDIAFYASEDNYYHTRRVTEFSNIFLLSQNLGPLSRKIGEYYFDKATLVKVFNWLSDRDNNIGRGVIRDNLGSIKCVLHLKFNEYTWIPGEGGHKTFVRMYASAAKTTDDVKFIAFDIPKEKYNGAAFDLRVALMGLGLKDI